MTNKEDQVERKGFLKGTAIGVAAGAVAGAIAGVLFAPQSGKETRAQLKRVMQKSANELDRKVERVKSQVKDFSDVAGKDLTKLLARAGELKKEIMTFANNTFDKGVDLNEDVRKEARRLIDESQKVAADLDRILARKLTAAKELATDTGTKAKSLAAETGTKAKGLASGTTAEVGKSVKTAKKNVKK